MQQTTAANALEIVKRAQRRAEAESVLALLSRHPAATALFNAIPPIERALWRLGEIAGHPGPALDAELFKATAQGAYVQMSAAVAIALAAARAAYHGSAGSYTYSALSAVSTLETALENLGRVLRLNIVPKDDNNGAACYDKSDYG